MQRSNPEIAKKYKTSRWIKLRKFKLIMNPYCERCAEKGIYNATYIIHHKEYISEVNYMNDDVFYNIENLESLCLDCHNTEHFGKKKDFYFDPEGNPTPITPGRK